MAIKRVSTMESNYLKDRPANYTDSVQCPQQQNEWATAADLYRITKRLNG